MRCYDDVIIIFFFFCFLFCFFFNDTATTEIYTLSLHDALPIYALADYWPWVLEMKFKSFPERKSYLLSWRSANHPSKPEQKNLIRAVCGKEFLYITINDENPERACKLSGLSTNDLCGWLSTASSKVLGKVLPDSFEEMRQNIIKANEQRHFGVLHERTSLWSCKEMKHKMKKKMKLVWRGKI